MSWEGTIRFTSGGGEVGREARGFRAEKGSTWEKEKKIFA
jgi:hypothetical protein